MSKENYDFPDKDGRFGDFGGKYVSETLISALDQLGQLKPSTLPLCIFHSLHIPKIEENMKKLERSSVR